MPKYRYTVVNPDNKRLQGTISAPDEKSARNELNELEFSILNMEEIPEEEGIEEEMEIPTFEFAATDKNQKRVVGTIQAEDRYTAFKRLVTEYGFEVEYVIDNNLSEEKKEKERKKGSYDIYSKFEEEQTLTKEKETSDEKDLKEFEKKQEVLKQQINFVLDKVKEMLDLYGQELKPVTKEKIRQKVEKLLRIKNSTNLDYIRKTAEDLLNFLQKEEIFLHEDQRVKEKTKMVVAAQNMMMALKKGKSKTSINLTEALRSWRQENIIENENPSYLNKFLDFFVSLIIGAKRENTEILAIKRKIESANSQLKQFAILYFQAPSSEFKAETKNSLKRVWSERRKLKKQLKEARNRLKEARKKSAELTGSEKLILEIHNFTGWLLAFYLIYYFASIYAVSKDFGITEIPFFFYIYRSAFLKYFLATLFLLHSAISIKINFFKRNETATLIITPVFIVSTLLIYFNF